MAQRNKIYQDTHMILVRRINSLLTIRTIYKYHQAYFAMRASTFLSRVTCSGVSGGCTGVCETVNVKQDFSVRDQGYTVQCPLRAVLKWLSLY